MNTCSVNMANGANVNCVTPLKKALALMIFEPSTSFANEQAVDNEETFRALIQETEKLTIIPLRGIDNTAPEAVTTDDAYGNTIFSSESAGSLMAYGKINACDFRELLQTFKGGTYRVGAYLEGGQVYLSQSGSNIQGMLAQVFATAMGIPTNDGQDQQFRIQVAFQDVTELNNYAVVPVGFTLGELLEYVPIGLDMTVSSVSGSTLTANVKYRCTGEAYTGTLTGEAKGQGNVLEPTFTPSEDGGGVYTVTVTKDSVPTDFVAGDYQNFRLTSKTGAVYQYVTNIKKAEV